MANAIAARSRIELQEFGAPVVCRLEGIDVHALEEANKRWTDALRLASDPIRLARRGDGLVELRAEAVTGVIRVGQTDIEIAPKFLQDAQGSWQTVLWRILAAVEGGHVEDDQTSAHESPVLPLTDLLADMFLNSFAKGAARGLPRSYVSEQASGFVLRGSLDLSRISEWIAQPWVAPYVASVLTDDTPLAQLLRWAANRLSETVKSPLRSRALREISASLSHVGILPPDRRQAQRIALGPQHQALEAARVVGLLLLQGAGVQHARGARGLSGFLWNSDVIYENYVSWLCKRAASSRGKRVAKNALQFGEVIYGSGSWLETTPDVVFRNSRGVAVAVSDAKYKRLGTRPKASDTYQVLTAAHILGCQRISLTYPVAQYRRPTVWRVSSALGNRDIELTALPLNLMSLTHPNGHQPLIDTIGDWLEGILFADEDANVM